MQAAEGEIDALMTSIYANKRDFFLHVHQHLRSISFAQSKIRDFENSLSMLKEAHAAQKRHFAELEHLEKLPGEETRMHTHTMLFKATGCSRLCCCRVLQGVFERNFASDTLRTQVFRADPVNGGRIGATEGRRGRLEAQLGGRWMCLDESPFRSSMLSTGPAPGRIFAQLWPSLAARVCSRTCGEAIPLRIPHATV